MPTSSRNDAIIIGAGHNGLVTAFYLARAGYRVRVLERRHVAGGAAVTEEFHPGYRNSTCSYTVSLLNPRVIADMDLAHHGLRVVERPVSNFLPLDDENYLILGGGLEATQREFAKFSAKDAAALPDYYARLERVADVLRGLALRAPPETRGLADLVKLGLAGNVARGLDETAQRDCLEIFTRSAREYLDGWFESAPVKAAFGFDGVVGNFAGPDSPGSAYVLLHHVFGEVNGNKGAWGHAIGGMGAISQAMVRACEKLGVEITLDIPVTRILVENGRAVGIATPTGEHRAQTIVSNIHPKLLFEHLLPADSLPADFRRRIASYRSGSGTLRMNVALSGLPRFTALPEPGPHLSSGIIIAPSLDYMEQAWLDARVHGWSRAPIVEMLIPSTLDDSLAPPGHHVASLFCQQFAPTLPDGRSWDEAKDAAVETILQTVERAAPGFRQLIVGLKALTPLDLERDFALVGGDIFHGRMSLDQLWAARPVLGSGGYRAPVPGLYMCGSGTHPGGGVTGAPGFNAAHAILADRSGLPWKRWAA